jgi:hypothetical protein
LAKKNPKSFHMKISWSRTHGSHSIPCTGEYIHNSVRYYIV